MTSLTNQGSYGCIYHPSISCKSKTTNPKYITKVQRDRTNSEREERIGKEIKRIPNYRQFFGPIESSCDISISNIQETELNKCEFMKEEPQDKYVANKIRYIGSEIVSDYFLRILRTAPNQIPRIIVEQYKYILNSLVKLQQKRIVHLDLYEKNILIDQKSKNPIIIDFGLSFKIDDLKNLTKTDQIINLRSIFVAYGVDYIPWCIDIAIITYVHKLEDIETLVTQEQLNEIIGDFFEKNPLFITENTNDTNKNNSNNKNNSQYFSDSELAEYIKIVTTYFSEYIGKSWREFIDAIINVSVNSWDNYSIAAIFYLFLVDSTHHIDPVFMPLINLLKTIILASPKDRMNAQESLSQLNDALKSISKPTRNLGNLNKDSEHIKKNLLENKKEMLEREAKIQRILEQ